MFGSVHVNDPHAARQPSSRMGISQLCGWRDMTCGEQVAGPIVQVDRA